MWSKIICHFVLHGEGDSFHSGGLSEDNLTIVMCESYMWVVDKIFLSALILTNCARQVRMR